MLALSENRPVLTEIGSADGQWAFPPSGGKVGLDGVLGVRISRDPLEEEAGLNLYAYVNNDPINDFDPEGAISPKQISAIGKILKAALSKANKIKALTKTVEELKGKEKLAKELLEFYKKCPEKNKALIKETEKAIQDNITAQALADSYAKSLGFSSIIGTAFLPNYQQVGSNPDSTISQQVIAALADAVVAADPTFGLASKPLQDQNCPCEKK